MKYEPLPGDIRLNDSADVGYWSKCTFTGEVWEETLVPDGKAVQQELLANGYALLAKKVKAAKHFFFYRKVATA